MSRRSSRVELDQRVDKAEELLCAGLSPSSAERKLAQDFDVTTRQARKYVARVYLRWDRQKATDAPHRREKVYRMAERFYAKALVEKQYTAASNTLNLLAKLSGALTQDSQKDSAIAAELGPVPDEPTAALIYAQKAMVLALREVISNPSIDPERRLRWISEFGGRIGVTHAKALVQHKLAEVANRVMPNGTAVNDDAGEAVQPGDWTRFRDAGAGDSGPESLPRSGAGPSPEDD